MNSCPPIAFYDGAFLDHQLSIANSNFIHGGGASFDSNSNTIWLSKILKWYQADFGGWDGVKKVICQASVNPELWEALNNPKVKVRYRPYDWSINHLI